MTQSQPMGTQDPTTRWIHDAEHRAYLKADARAQLRFFHQCLRAQPGFHLLDHVGRPRAGALQEIHSTARMVHSYALGQLAGYKEAADVIDHGMAYLWSHHRDTQHGGYVVALNDQGEVTDDTKLAYGHVFVLLAGASAKMAGHPDADRLIDDATAVLEQRFWEEEPGLFADEFRRDWRPFSSYRGMNANMHGIEALLTAYEATGDTHYLTRAGRILAFFSERIAPRYGWRLPEHYTENWEVDPDYEGNVMFRPAATTPGHSFEIARLILQHWDLRGQPDDGAVARARRLFDTALRDATDHERGGFVYTVDFEGQWLRRARYWWPVTEAIGTAAAFLKIEYNAEMEAIYRRLWRFAEAHLIDQDHGGWHPELDEENRIAAQQFQGKPDIYHSLQAALYPLVGNLSHIHANLE